MNSTRHSFMDIFETDFQIGQETVRLQKIIIPIIQRDYAQGRLDPETRRIRSRFLNSLYAALEEPVTLDFVYGDIDANGVMTPLDGQQRLTTLFLLHWYAARKANVSPEESAFLSRFGYETRYSARDFCRDLAAFTPSFKGHLSEEIIDQAWFPLEWKKDPTIRSMLVMLDAIDDKFKDAGDLWGKLRNGAVTFYFLPIKDIGLTDELYIKMNSRGKPLTRFEHFKAELERCVRSVDEAAAGRILYKIDREWTDLLWRYRNSGSGIPDDVITDDEFLKYFRFVCDVICYRNGESPQGKSTDEFDLLAEHFTGEAETVRNNVETLESYFDCWCRIEGFDSPAEFLQSCMSYVHAPGKIVVESRYRLDILEDCLHSYADKSGRSRQFPLNRIVLLYAVTCFLRNRGKAGYPDFVKRLRCVNNLIQNSENEISDRIGRNRLPAILLQTETVMLTGTLSESIDINFNGNQIAEEREKKAFLEGHPEKADLVYELEDHQALRGQISIVGLDHVDYAPRFASLFSCDWDLIDCALMSVGDYGQQERTQNNWRWQYASKKMKAAWDELFHKSGNSGFERTKDVLIKLLSRSETFTNELLKEISDKFLTSCESSGRYPWRYYYIKYDAFRPGSYGKYSNNDVKAKPYMFSVLQTRTFWSSNTYMPYLKEADNFSLSRDSMGQRLVYGDVHVICSNSAYLLRDNKTETVLKTFPIQQNDEGIDTEDRIILLKKLIDSGDFLEGDAAAGEQQAIIPTVL